MATQDSPWIAAQKEADAFVGSFSSNDLGASNLRNKVMVEVARQLILLNGNIVALTDAVHRNADAK